MNEVLKCIYGRASVRSYTSDIICEEDLTELLKAGFSAPNGMNTQAVEFVIIQNEEEVLKLSEKAKKLFVEMLSRSGEPDPNVVKMCSGDLNIFYGTPNLIFIFANKTAATPVEDGCLAAENIMLAASSMGYGTCFIGFAAGLGSDPLFRKDNNVPDDHTYVGCLAIGVPSGPVEQHSRADVKILNWSK